MSVGAIRAGPRGILLEQKVVMGVCNNKTPEDAGVCGGGPKRDREFTVCCTESGPELPGLLEYLPARWHHQLSPITAVCQGLLVCLDQVVCPPVILTHEVGMFHDNREAVLERTGLLLKPVGRDTKAKTYSG